MWYLVTKQCAWTFSSKLRMVVVHAISSFFWFTDWAWIAGEEKDKLGVRWWERWVDGFDIPDSLCWRLPCSWVSWKASSSAYPWYFLVLHQLLIVEACSSNAGLFQKFSCHLRYTCYLFIWGFEVEYVLLSLNLFSAFCKILKIGRYANWIVLFWVLFENSFLYNQVLQLFNLFLWMLFLIRSWMLLFIALTLDPTLFIWKIDSLISAFQ